MRNTAVLPLQPLVRDGDGRLRFRGNALVRYLLEESRHGRHCDLNTLAAIMFDQEDREQFAQLIGYSVNGFSELSYVSDETYARVEQQVIQMNSCAPAGDLGDAHA